MEQRQRGTATRGRVDFCFPQALKAGEESAFCVSQCWKRGTVHPRAEGLPCTTSAVSRTVSDKQQNTVDALHRRTNLVQRTPIHQKL